MGKLMWYNKGVTEKKKPSHDLEAFQQAFASVEVLKVTGTAVRDAAALDFGRQEIIDILQTMRPAHFYKSMTSHADHRVWQDVYHVPSVAGVLYVKFTSDVLTGFYLLSFKEKDNE